MCIIPLNPLREIQNFTYLGGYTPAALTGRSSIDLPQ